MDRPFFPLPCCPRHFVLASDCASMPCEPRSSICRSFCCFRNAVVAFCTLRVDWQRWARLGFGVPSTRRFCMCVAHSLCVDATVLGGLEMPLPRCDGCLSSEMATWQRRYEEAPSPRPSTLGSIGSLRSFWCTSLACTWVPKFPTFHVVCRSVRPCVGWNLGQPWMCPIYFWTTRSSFRTPVETFLSKGTGPGFE